MFMRYNLVFKFYCTKQKLKNNTLMLYFTKIQFPLSSNYCQIIVETPKCNIEQKLADCELFKSRVTLFLFLQDRLCHQFWWEFNLRGWFDLESWRNIIILYTVYNGGRYSSSSSSLNNFLIHTVRTWPRPMIGILYRPCLI